jgi:N-alpha-acetyl-L-2,4-diaminobutyrate deacetylase
MHMDDFPLSPIACDVPFDRDGVHHGHLRLPCSRDDSAWGAILIPICVVRRGEGPTALLTGGNHGDEYEGPIALRGLAATLDPTQVTGRVIILPVMNVPAFHAGRRTSPLDGGNLNRLFPGRPDGGPTEKIADYVTRYLLPMADVVLDYHSGGRTLDFLPFAAAHLLDDPEHQGRCEAAMRAFAAPFSMMLREIDPVGMFDTTVERMGKTFVTTELGGGGSATARSVAIARRGARNLLIHAGILSGEPEPAETRMLDTTGDGCFHFAEAPGLLEPLVDLGDPVRAGAPLARLWPHGRTDAPPQLVEARATGLLAARHFPGLVQPGDCLAVVAAEA